jgi:hypothetical protein
VLDEEFFTQCDLLSNLAGEMIARNAYFASLFVFDLIDYLHSNGERLCEALLGVDGGDYIPRLNEVVLNFVELARRLLIRFEEDVFKDANKRLSPDGTVHELSSNTLAFVAAVYEYAGIAGNVLRPQEEIGSAQNGIVWVDARLSLPALGGWILSVMKSLRSNLAKKAQGYDDAAHIDVFLLNNYDHILSTLASSPAAEAVKAKSPQF